MSKSKSCNSHRKRELKRRLFRGRQQASCCFCNRVLGQRVATLEHVLPLSEGGSWHISNLRISCKACNQERGVLEFGDFLRAKQASR